MKTKIITAAAALSFIVVAAQAFAADRAASQQQQSESSNLNSHCASILANPEEYSPAAVKYCRSIY